MANWLGKFVPLMGILLILAILCSGSPLQDKLEDEKTKVDQKEEHPIKETHNGRTILKDGMDMMKDMFNFGAVTWVPLGSLLFGNKDDSIGFAKWPSNNKN